MRSIDQQPRPDRARADWQSLNGQWDFALFHPEQSQEEASFAAHRQTYDQTINVPYAWGSPLSGVKDAAPGVGWYRRTTNFQPKDRVWLCIGGCDDHTVVYINGRKAMEHDGAYTPIECDVTELWQAGDNVIEVRAEDLRLDSHLYGKQGYGEIQGIWQTVWLENRPAAYIKDFTIITRLDGQVDMTVRVAGEGLVTALFDGQQVVAPSTDGEARLSLKLEQPRLWTPDAPELYEGTLCFVAHGSTDTVSTYFGVREIGTCKAPGKDHRWITLNGKPLYLNGALDQAFYPDGYFTAPSDEELRTEVWRLKRLGLNMVRIHIKTEEPRKLYWMDRMGMLVMQDVPCFWGNPVEEARATYEAAWPQILQRDINHPSIFSFVIFNESWGLLTREEGREPVYLPETQQWVHDVWQRAKALDPTRLIEDNSPCRYDHTETDINSWHFYLNGYETVRDHVREVVEKTYPGSTFNCAEGWQQGDAPLMNSECGLVWGVDESAGDSDLGWQYHYMLNEYRLHDKVNGFIFTELHDVVNEFNGYYRIDGADKDFGYGSFCRGMTVADLHAPDMLAVDAPPCQTLAAETVVRVPLVLSCFTDAHQGQQLTLAWELWHDGLCGRVIDGMGIETLSGFGWGANPLEPLTLTMPREAALCILSLYLKDAQGNVISRNFTTFEVNAPVQAIICPVSEGAVKGEAATWLALGEQKRCIAGAGEISWRFTLPQGEIDDITLHMELGAKRLLTRDQQGGRTSKQDLDFMLGYRVDRGEFRNSYWMTDERKYPSKVTVKLDGEALAILTLENDWADTRGVLSWHHQAQTRLLDEAGSYGEAIHLTLPSRVVARMKAAGAGELTLCCDDGGLAVYDAKSGRYPWGIWLTIR